MKNFGRTYSIKLSRFLIFTTGIFYVIFALINTNFLKLEIDFSNYLRLTFAGFLFCFVLLTFTSEWIRKNVYILMYALTYLMVISDVLIGIQCHFVFDHFLNMIVSMIILSLFIVNRKQLYAFLMFNVLLVTLVACFVDGLLVSSNTMIMTISILAFCIGYINTVRIYNAILVDNAQANLMAIYHHSHQTITLLNLDYFIIDFNSKAAEEAKWFTGKNMQLGDYFIDYIQEDLKNNYLSHLERCKYGAEVQFETFLLGPNSEKLYFEFRFSPIYSSNHQLIAIAFFTLNITEKRLALNELISSKINQDLIFKLSPVPLVVTRASDGKIITANTAMLKLMEYPFHKFDHLDAAIFYKDVQSRAYILNQIITKGYIDNYEVELVTYNHLPKWGLISGHLFQYEEEECLLINIHDITDRKAIELENLKAKNAAEEAVKLKSNFLSVMSHEIRTPMNAVIGVAELLLNNEPRADQVPNLQALQLSGYQLLSVINEILDLSKIEAGKVELEQVTMNLVELIEAVKFKFEESARKKGIDLLISLDPQIATPVVGDYLRLSQVLNNLVDNAIKFTTSGKVMLDVTHLSTKTEKMFVMFKVEDTGVGIRPSEIDNVFASYAQLNTNRKPKLRGAGLGLSIAGKLLELMGSKVQVMSEYGHGSCFSFKIGFDLVNHDVAVSVEPEVKGYDFNGVKLLIVDDNDINVLILSQFLKMWGIGYDVANNGIEAVEMVGKKDYDLVLMDMQMPELDGIEATLAIRKMGGKYLDLKIVLLSAAFESEIKQQMKIASINDYVSKPFEPEQLLHKIAIHTLFKH